MTILDSILKTINTVISFVTSAFRTLLTIITNVISWVEYSISIVTYIIPNELLTFIMIGLILSVIIWLIGRN